MSLNKELKTFAEQYLGRSLMEDEIATLKFFQQQLVSVDGNSSSYNAKQLNLARQRTQEQMQQPINNSNQKVSAKESTPMINNTPPSQEIDILNSYLYADNSQRSQQLIIEINQLLQLLIENNVHDSLQQLVTTLQQILMSKDVTQEQSVESENID